MDTNAIMQVRRLSGQAASQPTVYQRSRRISNVSSSYVRRHIHRQMHIQTGQLLTKATLLGIEMRRGVSGGTGRARPALATRTRTHVRTRIGIIRRARLTSGSPPPLAVLLAGADLAVFSLLRRPSCLSVFFSLSDSVC